MLGDGWYGFALTPDDTKECIEALEQTAQRHERPAELGELEITVTPVGPFDRRRFETYADLGVDRLVVLPRSDATRAERHAPVPLDDILRNLERVREAAIDVHR
jgi:hypothetical protein